MHRSVKDYVRVAVEQHELQQASVLDVGSMNVNGTPRAFFHGAYHGVDMRPGPAVDEVCDAHHLSAHGPPDRVVQYDVIVCLEMLEHDTLPWVSVEQMRQCCKPGGLLILTCRGFDERGAFPLHEHPSDVYRFTVDGVRSLLRWQRWETLDVRPDPQEPGVFALARRPG